MNKAIEIIEREIAQRKLANTHKKNLRYKLIEEEIDSLKKALNKLKN